MNLNTDTNGREREILCELLKEYRKLHEGRGLIHSAHEAYALMLPKLEAFWSDTKCRRACRKQLIEIAAIAISSLLDLQLRQGISSHEGEAMG